MNQRLVRNPDVDHRPARSAAFACLVLASLGASTPPNPADARRAEPARAAKPDPRIDSYRLPQGFKIRVAAAEPTLLDPAAMAFDDRGRLYVAEWRPADRSFETLDAIPQAGGGVSRVRRARKSSTDVVKRLVDDDGDGVYESSEVVIEGCEMPTSILPFKDSLYLTCVGRLEKWADEDGDGRYEVRTVVLDGFAAADHRGLGGATLGLDGWLYLTAADAENHVLGPDGSRVDLSRTGGVFRATPDGSRLDRFAMGLRNPDKGLAFDDRSRPFLIDGDHEDGSRLQGLRLINPLEEGDYGCRTRAGQPTGRPDFDRAAVDGERPGRLPVVARLGRGTASGLIAYHGKAFPEALRGALIVPDPTRRVVRGFKVDAKGASTTLAGESTLIAADDEQFRPVQVALGPDGALYVLDQRGQAPDDRPAGGEGKAGRLYRVTWEGEGATGLKPGHWDRIVKATTDELVFKHLTSDDLPEAERALRELVDRGPGSLVHFLGWAGNAKATLATRLLGIQGARQFWCDQVETTFATLLGDPEPEVRRLAAQSLAWEPKGALPRLVPKLAAHLDDADGRVAREVALAIGRHAEPRPQQAAATLLRWLLAHPKADPSTRDGFVRALERLGDAGVEEVALAIRTRRGAEREAAVALFAAFRTAPAADRLQGLVEVPDLSDAERIALIRRSGDFPPDVPAPTLALADWVLKHNDLEPPLKLAALEACRMAGNPASALVLALLDDEDDAVRRAAAGLAARSRPPGAIERLTNRLKSRKTPDDERLELVRVLGHAGPRAFDALDAAYLASEDPAFRLVALRSMAEADLTKAVPSLEFALAGPDPASRTLAARALGESSQTASLLGKAILNRTARREELPIVVASLRAHDSKENRKLLAAIDEDADGTLAINQAEVLEKVDHGSGDPWAGLGIFFRESSRCATCHQVEGRGGSLGPQLTLDPASPRSADRILESILSPSKVIEPGYPTTRVKLKDGQSFVGLVAAREGKLVTLREAGGREVRIAPELIAVEESQTTSVMPEHVALSLAPDELVDLVAFLRSKVARSALTLGPRRVDHALAIGPFGPGADRARVALDRVEPSKDFEGLDGAKVGWVALESTASGRFNLRGEFGPRPGRAYLAAEVRSAEDQLAALRFAVEGPARVYLNGSKVADVPAREASAMAAAFFGKVPSSLPAPLPDLARLKLRAGSNLLLIAVDREDDNFGDVRTLLEVLAPGPVEFRLPRD